MVEAQIMNATGITLMFARKFETTGKGPNKITSRTGEFAQITEPKEILELLNGDGEGDYFYKITTKAPSVESFKALLEHSVGKPKEPGRGEGPVDSLAVIINNIQKDGSRSSTVTVVPKQIKSNNED